MLLARPAIAFDNNRFNNALTGFFQPLRLPLITNYYGNLRIRYLAALCGIDESDHV